MNFYFCTLLGVLLYTIRVHFEYMRCLVYTVHCTLMLAAHSIVQFKEIAYAYEILGNPEKRKEYDEGGEEALKGGGGGGGEGFDPFDVFDMFFGGGGRRRRGQDGPRKGKDTLHQVCCLPYMYTCTVLFLGCFTCARCSIRCGRDLFYVYYILLLPVSR